MIGENWNRKIIWKTIIGCQEMSHPSKKNCKRPMSFPIAMSVLSSRFQSSLKSGLETTYPKTGQIELRWPSNIRSGEQVAPKQEADWHMIDKRISPAAANCERTGKACESWNVIIWVGKKWGSLLKHKRGLWCETIRWLKIWKILAPLGFFSAASSMSPWSVIRRSLSPGFVDDDWRGFPACS